MEQQTVIKKGRGLNVVEELTLIFIVLKACKLIEWSWLWVLSPIWITLCLAIVSVLLQMIIDHTQR